MFKLYKNKGSWIKGNLHTHTTNSDGKLSPQDVIKYYRDHGYKLLSLTDHNKITKVSPDDEMLLITGSEISVDKSLYGGAYHLVVLGIDDENILKKKAVNDVCDYTYESGGLVFIAHPYWTGLVLDDLHRVRNFTGIEVYNTGCDVEVGKGFSSVHWDELSSSDRLVWGIAVDDAHRYFYPPYDAAGGWIWVKIDNEDIDDILKSLVNGLFYSSMGPEFIFIEVTDTIINARFTPSNRVDIISNNGNGLTMQYFLLKRIVDTWPKIDLRIKEILDEIDVIKDKETKVFIKMGKMKININFNEQGITFIHINSYPCKKYMRLEITDKNGKKAWSNPVFPDKL